jgi:hypothetical protein
LIVNPCTGSNDSLSGTAPQPEWATDLEWLSSPSILMTE